VDVLAVARRPERNMSGPILHALAGRSSYGEALRAALEDAARPIDWRGLVARATGRPAAALGFEVRPVEHLTAQAASAFARSRLDEAAILVVDGAADYCSTLLARGRGAAIEPLERVLFPHSLGIFYAMVAQLAGLGEAGLAELSRSGGPRLLDAMRAVVRPGRGAAFELDLDFFRHAASGAPLAPVGEIPREEPLYSDAAVARFGPPPGPGAPPGARERDLAFAAQRVLEERLVDLAARLRGRSSAADLVYAGSLAANAPAAAALRRSDLFRAVEVARARPGPAAAMGAALSARD
jgi:carbamoyltransferase